MKLATYKYHFDLGSSHGMTFINTPLLILLSSDKIGGTLGISSRVVVICGIPLGILSLWLLGLILDKSGFAKSYQTQQNERNEMLKGLTKL